MALRISRTVFSTLSGTRLLACLIVAPQRATMSQKSPLTQSAHSVRQVLTAYTYGSSWRGGVFMIMQLLSPAGVATTNIGSRALTSRMIECQGK